MFRVVYRKALQFLLLILHKTVHNSMQGFCTKGFFAVKVVQLQRFKRILITKILVF